MCLRFQKKKSPKTFGPHCVWEPRVLAEFHCLLFLLEQRAEQRFFLFRASDVIRQWSSNIQAHHVGLSSLLPYSYMCMSYPDVSQYLHLNSVTLYRTWNQAILLYHSVILSYVRAVPFFRSLLATRKSYRSFHLLHVGYWFTNFG